MPIIVWAYGSRVNGSAHEGSDVDLTARSPDLSLIPFDAMYDLCDKIRDSNIPILVELREWVRLPESFKKNVEHQYEVLYDYSINYGEEI